MATRKIAPTVTATDVTHTLATAKPSSCGAAHIVLVTTYGDEVADRFAAAGCKRLPRHSVTEAKGHVAAKPVGLLTAKQRATRKASLAEARKAARVTKRASTKSKVVGHRTVTIGGTKYLAVVERDGTVTISPVTSAATESLTGGVEVLSADRYTVSAESPTAKPRATRKPATRKPRVRNLPEAESVRRVAAPAKVTRTRRTKSDPTANKAVGRSTRQGR